MLDVTQPTRAERETITIDTLHRNLHSYLGLLFEPNDEIAFLAFKDSHGNYVNRTPTQISVSDVQKMADVNERGYGASIQLQPVSGGNSKQNIVEVRHAFVELDQEAGDYDRLRLAVDSGKIPAPHFALKTSPVGAITIKDEKTNFFDKYQVIWRVEKMSVGEVENLNYSLAKALNGDLNAVDAGHPLRLPYFKNQKYHSQPVVELVKAPEQKPQPLRRSDFKIPMLTKTVERVEIAPGKLVADGERQKYLKSHAVKLRKEGHGPEVIEAVLTAYRDYACEPGMSRPDLPSELAKWACGLSPAELLKQWNERKHGAKADAEPSRLQIVRADNVDPTLVRWLWQMRVAIGKITCFCGNPDNGKSLVTVDLVAAVTRGRKFYDGENTLGPSEVIMLLAEDALNDTVVPRLMAAGADLSKIHFVTSLALSEGYNGSKKQRMLQLDSDIAELRKALEEYPNVRLVVIDPISNYLGKTKMTDERDVRQFIMNPLAKLAEDMDLAIITVLHLNKKEDLSAINRVGGAMAFVGAARSAWVFMYGGKEEDPEQFYMLKLKNNIAPRMLGGLTYKIREQVVEIEGVSVAMPVIQWTGKTDSMADDMLAKKDKAEREEPLHAEKAWLVRFLAKGQTASSEVIECGLSEGFSQRSLERAKAALRIDSVRTGRGASCWKLPSRLIPRAESTEQAEQTLPF